MVNKQSGNTAFILLINVLESIHQILSRSQITAEGLAVNQGDTGVQSGDIIESIGFVAKRLFGLVQDILDFFEFFPSLFLSLYFNLCLFFPILTIVMT